jgi:hypothetical protein
MRGGSRPGKAKNRDNGIAQGAELIDRDYFSRVCLLPAPISEAEFERRFRMPRSVYEVLREGLLETDWYFLQKQVSLGKLGASADQKVVCALRQMADSVPTDFSRRSRSPSARESGQCRALRRTGHDAGAASRTSAILPSVRKSVFIWHRIHYLANQTSPILRQNNARSLWIGIPKRWKIDQNPIFLGHVRPPTNLLGFRFWTLGPRWCRVKRF